MFENSLDIITALIVFILGLIFTIKVSNYFGVKRSRSLTIYMAHNILFLVSRIFYKFWCRCYNVL